ncbi:hypothetical protein RxyAA322_13130 [Rubrobacter xylanophilus]|uniref:Uncharacterized protein n=1 Tax=Rubrobacter xylanophilus TaxID=49319 RepID=A0A510HHM6_9ACTN|nr:hypothetical protein RxyAA322_13130 [Rubrobacter xylanophilus]
MTFDHDLAALHYWPQDVLDLAHRGAVEGSLQAGFVHITASHLAEPLRVEQALPPRFERQMDECGLPRARRDTEVLAGTTADPALVTVAGRVETPTRAAGAPR